VGQKSDGLKANHPSGTGGFRPNDGHAEIMTHHSFTLRHRDITHSLVLSLYVLTELVKKLPAFIELTKVDHSVGRPATGPCRASRIRPCLHT
jgi:hypothetical protein